ncbi:MAG: phosphoribosylformylglycinamidine synthase subunit PurQ, partial [Acidobacteria bacterium]|nr:phosphoribosylformylglycinamidine synthase subunit PurQ [Acidobacteriota bacterium]MCA1734392.1 phosphoribosylformylglycinamidine synthase subunit PurQ [Acidobacteriota bacterium]
ADEATLDDLEANDQVVFRYADAEGRVVREANPNGSSRNIAGIINRERNVLGMMPHPERACESILGGSGGVKILRSIVSSMATK